MSTKIGIIAEGPIDHVLIPPLLERIARDRAQFTWPVSSDDVAEMFSVRKRGHGGVIESVRKLVHALDTKSFEHVLFVILLDRRTYPVQAEVRKLIRGKERFVLGVAIEEIEAWWLGDRTNTLRWAGFVEALPANCRYAAARYRAERDDDPKKTLHELTARSSRFDRCYGQGNLDLAQDFAEQFWQPSANLDEIASQCSQGYTPFEQKVTDRFRHIRTASGRLFY
jgi:hypothetical protein